MGPAHPTHLGCPLSYAYDISTQAVRDEFERKAADIAASQAYKGEIYRHEGETLAARPPSEIATIGRLVYLSTIAGTVRACD